MRTGFNPGGRVLGRVPKQPSIKVIPLPSPSKGINAVDPLATLDPTFCINSINMIPEGRGMRVRSGYRQFATNVGTGGVRTIIPFQGSTTASDRLFATTSAGIFDISAGGAGAWTADLTFGINSATSGIGVWTNFVLDNGAYFCFYADEANGLLQYEQGGAWAVTTGITGVAEADLVFCMQHKGRLWFVERNSGRSWYLASGAVAGAATRFDFGNKFKYGGALIGLWNWTVDGGDGIDDYLVAISSGGDVIVYRGSDPATAATWEVTGQYFIGLPPAGRRIANGFGGELFLLSQYGVLPMSRLVSGRPVQEQDVYASRNISPLIQNKMLESRTQLGWEIKNVPFESVLMVSTPKQTGFPDLQFVMSSKTSGWAQFQNVPYNCSEVYKGNFFTGGMDSVVYQLTGTQDAVALSGLNGTEIDWSLLTAFTDAGESGLYHRIQFMRPVFLSGSQPNYVALPRYDYDLEDPLALGATSVTTGALWDSALWDQAVWEGAAQSPQERVFGGSGIGRALGVALNGNSRTETLLVRIDLMFDTGGLL